MLTQYQTLARRLLNDQSFARINDFDLRDYINIGRGQIAGQGECVPAVGTVQVGPGTQSVPFSSITFAENTIAGPINIRMIWIAGGKRLFPREWPWFQTYVLTQPQLPAGPPKIWSQYRQGAAGFFFLNPLDTTYTLNLDASCYPIPLVDDTTPEILPYLWTDAVPFYAAGYALMAAQQGQAADYMMQRFEEMMGRARNAVTPGVQPGSYPQGPDPMMPNRLGVHPAQQHGQPTAGAMRGP